MPPIATRDAVLLLTHSGDFYTIDLVSQALARRGFRPIRFDTDLFPSSIKLSARAGDERPTHFFTEAGEQICTGEVRAVWMRKLWSPRMADDLDERYRLMCVGESVAALEGFLDAFHDARWVNDPQCQRAAENKQRQLRLATHAGLHVPRTLVTNDPAAAREFFAETKGETVAKLLRPVAVSMDADASFVYTNRVREEDLDGADALRHSPMVFQELIPKACELRVACVAGETFAGALDASATSGKYTDWRRAAAEECRWQKAELPTEVESGLLALMSELGIVFGAADLICTPSGEYVFLEVNPGGEWGMLERDLELDLALGPAHLVGVRVQGEVADDEGRRAARWAAAQQRAQAGEQLLALEGLDEVVVGAGVEPRDAGVHGVARGQHEDRDVAVRAQRAGDVDAVELGQPEVEDHEIGGEGVGVGERRLAVRARAHLVALHAQRALEHLRDLLVVLDDEHAWGAFGHHVRMVGVQIDGN